MNPHLSHFPTRTHVLLGVAIVVLSLGASIYGEYRFRQLKDEITVRDQLIASSTLNIESKIQALNDIVLTLSGESASLKDVLATEQSKNSTVQEQIGRVYDTVGTLDKLSKTDPQLLQKYSKIYFLNEHYTPDALSPIAPQFLFNKSSDLQIHSKVAPYLQQMISSARNQGIDIQVASAYRSFNTQAQLKSSYKVTYGAGTANKFSADQGYSEHQLGTTLDFTTSATGASFDGFEKTPAYTWLMNNAHSYGFTLSYPPNNKYYIYEPWHWRFVGVDLASRLKREGKFFYDFDQRDLDNYLLLIFN
ncbi:MAG: hypothetical protein RL094_394 [Candidatus Parcubacteria bacterium]|jgi:D-alanyl-D-alanine carboxypeptidase